MKRLFDLGDRREEFRLLVESHFARLLKKKKAGKQKEFNEILEKVLGGVRKYIAKRLATAVRNGKIPANQYTVDDFVNDLYVLAYDKFHEVKEEKALRGWLIKKANELLEDAIEEEEFDHLFMENIDKYSKEEWAEMIEEFSTDGDGDLVMEEELDDPSYPKHDYVLADAFIEDKEAELIEKLNKELSAKEIHYHIDKVVSCLPLPIRTTYNLTVNHGFGTLEIANIQMMSESEIEQNIEKARKAIKVYFKVKYSLSNRAKTKGIMV